MKLKSIKESFIIGSGQSTLELEVWTDIEGKTNNKIKKFIITSSGEVRDLGFVEYEP